MTINVFPKVFTTNTTPHTTQIYGVRKVYIPEQKRGTVKVSYQESGERILSGHRDFQETREGLQYWSWSPRPRTSEGPSKTT